MIKNEMWVRYSPDFLFDAKMSTNDAKKNLSLKNYRLRRDSVKLTGELSFGEI